MKNKLKDINMVSFIVNSMVSIRLLTLPRDVIQYAKNDGWISVLVMGFLSFFIGWFFYWIGNRYKGFNFSQICEKIYGKILAKIIMIGIMLYTLSSFGLGLRTFGDGIKIFLLDKTPLLLIISVMSLCCLYCLLKGIKTISIVMDILLPPILFFILLLVLLSTTNIDFISLQPIFYGGIKPILQGALQITDPFLDIGIIGYVLPYFSNNKGTARWIFLSIGIGILIHFIIVIMCILVFGCDEMKYLIFPTITLSKSIRLDVKILERAESFYMAAWIPITFTTLLLHYFISTLNLKALFNTKRDHLLIYGQIPIFFIIALLPQNIAEVFQFLHWNAQLSQILFFGLIPLTYMVELFKGRRKKR